jgi:3-keto-L-gulonate-6-phosphate decarboxylase
MNKIEKRTLEDIINDSKTINTKLVAEEILTWAINNVENFIDSEEKIFQISLTIDSSEGMSESQKLQNLYRAIPEDEDFAIAGGFNIEEFNKKTKSREKELDNLLEKVSNCRRILDEIVKECHAEMKNRKDLT